MATDYDAWLASPYDEGAEETQDFICNEDGESGCDFEGEVIGSLVGDVSHKGNGQLFISECPKCGREIKHDSLEQNYYMNQYMDSVMYG